MAIPFKREAPPVGVPFAETRHDPLNQQREQSGSYFSRAEPLSVRARHQLTTRLAALEQQLREAKYDEARSELQDLIKGYQAASEPILIRATGEKVERRVAAARGRRLQQYLTLLKPLVHEREDLLDRLDRDDRALGQRHEDRDREALLRRNALTYGQIILDTWTGLGFFAEGRSKKRTRKVEFERVHCTPTAIYYKIRMTGAGLFGRRRKAPDGVKVMQHLLDPSTIHELTLACSRQVTALPTNNNGAWLKVSLTDAGDDLPEYIHLRDVMDYFPDEDRHLLPIPLGVTPGRNIDFLYLGTANQAHLLVAGTTGGAKSNFLNLIILSLLLQYSAREVQFMLIDLKAGGVEFQPYQQLPHLLTPVVTDAEQLPVEFARLENMMKERGARFHTLGVRNIIEHNAQVPDDQRLSHVLVIFDEFASIHVPRKRKLTDAIHQLTLQLLAKARSFGIHIVICTQYPNVDVISSIGKANLSTRISGYFPQKSLSLAVFDSGIAAELPLVAGRMAALVNGQLFAVQTPHVPTEYIREILASLLPSQQLQPIERLPPLTAAQTVEAEALVKADAPQLPPQPGDKERVARVVLERLGGALASRRVYDVLKTEMTLARVQEILVALQADGRVELDGRVYVVEPRRGQGGRGFVLSPQDVQPHEVQTQAIAVDLNPEQQ